MSAAEEEKRARRQNRKTETAGTPRSAFLYHSDEYERTYSDLAATPCQRRRRLRRDPIPPSKPARVLPTPCAVLRAQGPSGRDTARRSHPGGPGETRSSPSLVASPNERVGVCRRCTGRGVRLGGIAVVLYTSGEPKEGAASARRVQEGIESDFSGDFSRTLGIARPCTAAVLFLYATLTSHSLRLCDKSCSPDSRSSRRRRQDAAEVFMSYIKVRRM